MHRLTGPSICDVAGASGQTMGLKPVQRTATPLPLRADRRLIRRIAVTPRTTRMREMKLQDLKAKSPAELVSFAEELEVENASTMRKQEQMFGILKQLSMRETDI